MKLFCFFVAVALCVLSLSSCGMKTHSTKDILGALMKDCGELPKGEIYLHSADDNAEDGFMSPYLREAMYGEGAEELFTLTSEYSIYISSFATPYEIAVFRCYSDSDGLKIENMCRQRANIVSVALRDTSFYALCQNVRIVRDGEYVIFLMTDEPDRMASKAKSLI